MTVESQQIAAIVDRFAPDIRQRLLNSATELAAIYRAGGAMQYPLRRDLCDPELRQPVAGASQQPADVISLAERRARHA